MSSDEFEKFIKGFISTCLLNIKDGASLYFCCNWKDSYPRFYFNLQEAGINISANIVWNKGSGGMGWQDYCRSLPWQKLLQSAKDVPVCRHWSSRIGLRHAAARVTYRLGCRRGYPILVGQ